MDSVISAPVADVAGAAPASSKRPARLALVVVPAACAVAGLGVGFLRAPVAAEATDNAYVRSDRTLAAARIRGQVEAVLVEDNQAVRSGQPLVRLDGREYAARVAAAEGDLALARAEVEAARAGLRRLDSELDLAAAEVRQVGARISAREIEAARAQAERVRYDTLADHGYAPRRDAERMRSEAASAAAAAADSRESLSVSRRQADVTLRRRAEASAALSAAEARATRALAALDLARQDEGHAVIVAPVDGVVADRAVNVGDVIQPATRLLTIVEGQAPYVVANFKETQTGRMRPGQHAEIRVDALPGVKLKARVESLAPGSGADFALLPFEPGAGNFTKIVQRVPVRLVIEPGQGDAARLRPGLSVRAKVRVAEGRTFLGRALP
ncbi:MAG: HlyD family secretion protein [Pseudomonadota bacterium]